MLLIVVPIAVLPMVVVLPASLGSAGIAGALTGLGALFVLVGVEIPLFFRVQRRRQTKILLHLGPGEFFAGTGSMYPFGGRRGLPAPGKLVFSETGVRFEPKRPGDHGLAMSWGEVERINLGPMPGKIGVGRLVLQLRIGETRVFSVGSFGTMAKTLAEHP